MWRLDAYLLNFLSLDATGHLFDMNICTRSCELQSSMSPINHAAANPDALSSNISDLIESKIDIFSLSFLSFFIYIIDKIIIFLVWNIESLNR